MDKTIDYYNKNAQTFTAGTVDVSFCEVQDRFLDMLPEEAYILDFGCGSGRDTKYFLTKGYRVDAIDGSEELCKIASKTAGISVKQMYFEDLDAEEVYDGIWACASILHLPKDALSDVLVKMLRAVKVGGYIYTSFKYGEQEGYRNGRYFTDFTEDSFKEYVKNIENMEIVNMWVSADVRPGREDERWLNLVMRKSDRP